MIRLPHALTLTATLFFLAANTASLADSADRHFGKPDPTRYDVPSPPRPGDVPYQEVERVLNSRCVVCHGCYDAPCQFKLGAWEGVARGASKEKVYDGERFSPVQPSRLFEDALSTSAWRARGFYPMLCERPRQDNVDGSVLAQMLLLKQKHPLPGGKILPDTVDLSVNREQQCTTSEKFPEFSRKFPLWGMPYGLPALSAHDQDLLLRWIREGASRPPHPLLKPELTKQISEWESWLNDNTPKRQLTARYLYEHLFLAHLYFGDDTQYFQLVRSRTPPSLGVDLIATRRPYDDPGVPRPYYRIVPLREAVVAKTHMPYRLDAARLKLWQRWFDDAPYEVMTLPGYKPEQAANPFVTFADIPAQSRYRFMLDEAQYTISGFIKGPVCRGQQALDGIDDIFWVFFMDPSAIDERDQERFLAANSQNLRLPAELESDAPILKHWLIYAEGQKRYWAARAAFRESPRNRELPQGIRLVWNGQDENGEGSGQDNPNAALTVFRHRDSATVEKGLIGKRPQSAWIISYPLLERLHYLLVAGYDVYGNVGHQLKSRLYMDFLRIEGEQNFLALLPDGAHAAIEQRWYRDAPKWTLDFVAAAHVPLEAHTKTELAGLPPERAYEELLNKLRQHVGKVLQNKFDLQNLPPSAPLEALTKLGNVRGASLQWLPQLTVIKLIPRQGDPMWLTLVNNSAHKNVAEIFLEDLRRLPAEDTLTLVSGVLGAYPNAFWTVNESQLPELTRRVAALNSDTDYHALMDRYGMRRTNPAFWALSDQTHAVMKNRDRVSFGLLDYNRLENR